MANESVAPEVSIPMEAAPDIKRALVYGLVCFQELLASREKRVFAEGHGRSWPEELRLAIPRDNPVECLQAFTDALEWIQEAETWAEQRKLESFGLPTG